MYHTLMENYTLPDHSVIEQTANPAQARAYLNKVYLWMAFTMVITAATAIYATQSAEILTWVASNIWLLCIGCLVIIVTMCLAARKLTVGALGTLLCVFAGVEGLLFGPILCVYTQESLGLTFACTAGMFGAMSLFGAMTKINMGSWGRGLTMALIGLLIALIANAIWGNGMIDLVLSGMGVVLFSILTAYDTQKLLQEGLYGTEEERSKGAILGALDLYLDFINLFLFLLRFLGRTDD